MNMHLDEAEEATHPNRASHVSDFSILAIAHLVTPVLLTIILAVLKYTNRIALSWLWVFSPIWVFAGLSLLIALIITITVLVAVANLED